MPVKTQLAVARTKKDTEDFMAPGKLSSFLKIELEGAFWINKKRKIQPAIVKR
ncbi:MAG: hypothetical protein WCK35_03040 [Chloroflexota bacterium]